jgi:toxin CptA
MTSAPAIAFEYRPSACSRWAGLGMAGLALASIGLSALPWWGRAALAVVVLVATARTQYRLQHASTLTVGWSVDGQWTLHTAAADEVVATLSSFRTLGGWVQLRLALPDRGFQFLVLASDNSDPGLRRRLRMRLATAQANEALPRI